MEYKSRNCKLGKADASLIRNVVAPAHLPGAGQTASRTEGEGQEMRRRGLPGSLQAKLGRAHSGARVRVRLRATIWRPFSPRGRGRASLVLPGRRRKTGSNLRSP